MENQPIVLKDEDFELNFLMDDEPEEKPIEKEPYKVLITDDDKEVHATTKLLLRNFKFEGHPLELLHAYSAKEAKQILLETPHIALIFLDVVMEEIDSGLKVVDYIRKELNNQKIRIILRTGQPGEAPEEKVIEAYDINDYRLKTELSATRLFTSVYEALRSYRDLMAIEMHRKGLEQIVVMSSKLFTSNSIEEFYNCILDQIMKFEKEGTSVICFREGCKTGGFIFLDNKFSDCNIVAATGKFEELIGKNAVEVEGIQAIIEKAHQMVHVGESDIAKVEQGYLIYRVSPFEFKTFIYVEGEKIGDSIDVLKEFLIHYDLALNHYLLNQKLNFINCEVIKSLDFEKAVDYVKNRGKTAIDSTVMEAFLRQFRP